MATAVKNVAAMDCKVNSYAMESLLCKWNKEVSIKIILGIVLKSADAATAPMQLDNSNNCMIFMIWSVGCVNHFEFEICMTLLKVIISIVTFVLAVEMHNIYYSCLKCVISSLTM